MPRLIVAGGHAEKPKTDAQEPGEWFRHPDLGKSPLIPRMVERERCKDLLRQWSDRLVLVDCGRFVLATLDERPVCSVMVREETGPDGGIVLPLEASR